MKSFLILISIFFINTNAKADCLEEYREKIKHYDSLLSKPRETFTITMASSAVSLPLMAAAGLLSFGTAIPTLATFTGVGSYYSYIKIRRRSHQKVLILLKQAEAETGKYLVKLQRYLNRRLDQEFSLADVARQVLDANQEELFCPYDIDSDRSKVMTIRQLRKALLRSL